MKKSAGSDKDFWPKGRGYICFSKTMNPSPVFYFHFPRDSNVVNFR